MSVTRYRTRLYEHYRSGLGLAAVSSEADSTKYILRRLLRGYVPEDRAAPILDLGCGSGMLVHLLRQAGYQNAVGVDTSVEQVAVAKAAGIIGIEQGDLLEFLRNTSSGSVAVVITWDVIEHLFKDESLDLAEQIARVLRPGGRWIIHVPNGDSPFFGRIRYGDWTHEQAFTCGSLDQLLRAVGFQEVSYEEDRPVVHGVISAFRRVLWHLFRSILRVYIAAETGDPGRRLIVSQNLMAVATKAARADG